MVHLRGIFLGFAVWLLPPALALADGQLKSTDFTIQYGPQGISSLKRVQDAYDTEYLAPNGVLGNLVIQYKAPADANWTVIRGATLAGDAAVGSSTINYSISAQPPGNLKADMYATQRGNQNGCALFEFQVLKD